MVKPTPGSKEAEVISAGTGTVKPKGKKEKVIGFLKRGVKKRCKNEKCGWKGQTEGNKCPKCGSDLTMERDVIGYLMSFLIYFGIIFASLSIVFGSFLSLLNTYIGQFIPPYVIVLLIALVVGYLLTKKSLVVGVIYCIILVAVLGFVFPLVSGIPLVFGSGIGIPGRGGIDISCYLGKLISGDMEGLQECYTSIQEEPPTYTGTKSYKSLKVIFGEEILGEYEIPPIFASTAEEPDPYFLPFYIKNLNPKGSGLKISRININYVKAWMNETEGFYFEAKTIEPKIIDLDPEEKVKIDAEKFTSSDGNYVDRFPCEEKKLKELRFETKLWYRQNVTHKRTLAIVRSKEDEAILSEDPNLRKQIYDIEPPSDGPVDLIITFTSPYVMGTRREDKIRMSVWVENKGSGEFTFLSKENVIIKAVGGLPDWIIIDTCEESNGNIKIEIPDKYEGPRFKKGMGKQFICDLRIEYYPDPTAAYQLITFEGNLKYKYYETSSFSEKVDRTFCD